MMPRTKNSRRRIEGNPLMAIDMSQLRDIRWQDLAIRFAFGAVISVIAGIVGLNIGERIGGILLAFPAILPATLTLIDKRQGKERSFHDLQGTVAGAFGLVGFGIVASVTFGHFNVLIVLVLAFLAWTLMAGLLYLVWAGWLRRKGVQL